MTTQVPHETTTETTVARRTARRLYQPPARLTMTAGVCLLLGLGSLVAGMLLAPRAAWSALLVNFLFWTGVAQGGIVLAAAFTLTEARWGRIVQRIASGTGAFLPFSLLLPVIVWAGRDTLLPWLAQPRDHPWFSLTGLLLRDSIALVAMIGLSLAFLTISIRADGQAERGQETGRNRYAWREREAWERHRRLLRQLAIAIIMVFFPVYALLTIDLIMGLNPVFQSTLMPVIYLAGSFYSALAITGVLLAGWIGFARLRTLITPDRIQDMANLMWAFGMVLGFLWWSQYFIIWMANLPLEAGHHILRWRVWPWPLLAWASLICAVAIPGLLLFSSRLKRNAAAFAGVGCIAALGVLLQRFLDVMPILSLASEPLVMAVMGGISLGFPGAFALSYLTLMRRIPVFPVQDPLFAEAVKVENVTV